MHFMRLNSDNYVTQIAQNIANVDDYIEITQSKFNELLNYFKGDANVLLLSDNYDIIISETEQRLVKYNRILEIQEELDTLSTYKGQPFDYWQTIFNSKPTINLPFKEEYKSLYLHKLALILELEELKEEIDYGRIMWQSSGTS